MKHFIITLLALGLAFPAFAKIVEKEVEYQAGDVNLKGFIAYDSSVKEQRPGVLVVHEWWGHNEYARERARKLAKLGYVAFAVDMYGDGKQASHPQDAQKFSSEIANNIELGKSRFIAAMNLLKQHQATNKNNIAAIGYCFGGAVVLQMAREGLDLDAVASFHGSLGTSHPAKPGNVKAKILIAHGGADPFVSGEQITGFLKEMNNAGAEYKFVAYSGAVHAFTNPAADEYGKKFNIPLRYNKAADQASWIELQQLLKSSFDQNSSL